MNIAYISPAYFSDVDVSLLSNLFGKVNITYFVIAGDKIRGSAIAINTPISHSGVYRGTEFPELNYLSSMIDLNNTFIIYRKPGTSGISKFFHTLRMLKMIKQFDLIHITHNLSYYAWPLFLFRNKIITSVHDPLPHSSTNNWLIEIMRKLTIKNCIKRILFNTKQIDEFCRAYNVNKSSVFISRLSCYTFLRLLNIRQDNEYGQYILFFGTVTGYKGVDVLLAAMEDIHDSFPSLKLVIAGKGNYDFDARKYECKDYYIRLNYFIENNKLASLISHSLFVVCPYKDATQSGVVMSSYALNKCVVATNVGGLPEMVVNNKYGLLVEPNNVESLRDGIVKMLNNQDMIHKFEANIERDYIYGDKSWEVIAEEMLTKCYKKYERHNFSK